jgi:hypothetical protein
MNFIPKSLFDSFEQDGEELTKLINGYIGYLKRSKQGHNEPGENQGIRESPLLYEAEPSE